MEVTRLTESSDEAGFSAAELEARKRLFHLTPGDEEQLAAFRAVVVPHIDDAIEGFHTFQLSVPEMRHLIEDPETLKRLRAAVRGYVLDLFGGPYDEGYVRKRLRIGLVHKHIGVHPRLYLSAFSTIHGILDCTLREAGAGNPDLEPARDALRRLLMFDMQLVFEAYIDSVVSEVESARKEIQQYATGLERSVAELGELSRRDPLTNLLNHRAFLEELRREMARSEREGLTLSLAYIDLNGFKEVNDAMGHQRGDQILREVAAIFVDGTRSSDIAFRYGGDEFAVLLPSCSIAQARQVCEKIISLMHDRCVEDVSLSIGIAESRPQSRLSMDELISAADTAMYGAKDLSRSTPGNHIVLAPVAGLRL